MIIELHELQRKYDRLVDKVRRMRGYQKEYFKYRARADLDRAKILERDVDKIIAEEVAAIKSNQKTLF